MISPVEARMAGQLGRFEKADVDRLVRRQRQLLERVVSYARERSRFYREKLTAMDATGLSINAYLATFPFTWPSDIEVSPQSFLCVNPTQIARVVTLMTSGTTGARKRIYFSQNDLDRTVDFFECGMRAMVRAGQHVLVLMSDEAENSIGRLLQTALARFDVSTRIQNCGWDLSAIGDAAGKADCIVGIPAEILYLCRTYRGLRPRSVLLSADFVPRSVIAAIESSWHCEVFTHYGMTETGYGCAVQCASREGYHIRAIELIIEIVDPVTGVACAAGEPGEIVITTLCNEAMPLIRYRTGDMSKMIATACGCGGVFPRLGRVEGRRENDIRLRNLSSVSIHQLDEWIFSLPQVRAFQAVLRREDAGDGLQLLIDANDYVDESVVAARLPEFLRFEIRYAKINPFINRAKRRIRVDDRRRVRRTQKRKEQQHGKSNRSV